MKDDHVYDIEQTVDDITTSLLRRAKARERDAWTKLIDTHIPLVYLWCRHRLAQAVDVENVGQEVFLSVSVGISNFQGDAAAFRRWLWTITINKIRDHYRAHNKQFNAEGGSDAQRGLLQVPDPTGDYSDDGSETHASELAIVYLNIVESIRNAFEETTWEAFKEVVIAERPPADVAADLGMSLNAVYIAKSRVLSRLRRELAQEGIG